MVGDSWAIHHSLLASVELEQEHSRQRLICFIVKLYLKCDSDVLRGSKHPKLLIFPIVDLARLELTLLVQYAFHSLSDWSRQKVSFELRELRGNLVTHFLSFFPDFFILRTNCLCLLFRHGFFHLCSSNEKWINQYLL